MPNLLDNIDLRGGVVENDTFNIDFTKDFESQIWELNEDLIQIKYNLGIGRQFIVDVGWHPGNTITNESSFSVCLVKNEDWERPLFINKCITKEEIIDALEKAVAKIYDV